MARSKKSYTRKDVGTMAMKLYVGGLPYSTTEEELSELFNGHGTVLSAAVIKDRASGRSKGFGFVEIEDPKDGEAAIAALNGTDFGGRSLQVNEARPLEERRPGTGRPREGRPSRKPSDRNGPPRRY
jgi:RNA recognition motif-containing protein